MREHKLGPAGFTLIEVLVALVIGVALIAAVGVASGNLVRQRAISADRSAAIAIAQRKLAELKNTPIAGLASGGPVGVDATGDETAGVTNVYEIEWTIDNPPFLARTSDGSPIGDMIRISVTVRHDRGDATEEEIVTLRTYRKTT